MIASTRWSRISAREAREKFAPPEEKII